MSDHDDDSPVVLRRVPTEVEANAIVAALAAEQVEAMTTGGFVAGFRAEAPGDLEVRVRRGDLEKANALLAKLDI